MTMIQTESPRLRIGAREKLVVHREEITFGDVAPGRVAVEVRVWNEGESASRPTVAVISAAPLGAFVAWDELARVAVPSIPPGGSRVVRVEADRVRVRPLGPPDRVPPSRLLTALGAGDAPRRGLPADLADLMGRGNPHFAGNFNVFVGERDVERHLARAVRIEPGRTNMAMFIVGMGHGPDRYAFQLSGNACGWDARLYESTHCRSLVVDPRGAEPIDEDQWVDLDRKGGVFMLALTPPAGCGEGVIAVHVTRRSSGQEALVEFSFDPSAAGAGCYVVG